VFELLLRLSFARGVPLSSVCAACVKIGRRLGRVCPLFNNFSMNFKRIAL